MKNLANVPPHLQRMLLELQRYDMTIKYRPGNQMQLADALSFCPARASQEIKLDMRVDYITFTRPWIAPIVQPYNKQTTIVNINTQACENSTTNMTNRTNRTSLGPIMNITTTKTSRESVSDTLRKDRVRHGNTQTENSK